MTEREKLIELLDEAHHRPLGKEYRERLTNIADHLLANSVRIPVRCKDCTVWKRREDGLINCPYCTDLKQDDDFCSRGERKTDG